MTEFTGKQSMPAMSESNCIGITNEDLRKKHAMLKYVVHEVNETYTNFPTQMMNYPDFQPTNHSMLRYYTRNEFSANTLDELQKDSKAANCLTLSEVEDLIDENKVVEFVGISDTEKGDCRCIILRLVSKLGINLSAFDIRFAKVNHGKNGNKSIVVGFNSRNTVELLLAKSKTSSLFQEDLCSSLSVSKGCENLVTEKITYQGKKFTFYFTRMREK